MAERSDITVDWGISPRLIEVALPSTEVIAQDLHDTLKSNTLQAGEADDSLENMDDDPIIDSAGKENLGGGLEVGITSTLLDAQVAFGRTAPRSTTTDTVTTAGTDRCICSGATFITDGVVRGDWVLNWTDQSVSEVLQVISETELRVRTPSGMAASSDDFAVNDVITVWEVDTATLAGGNFVAEDAAQAELFPMFTSFGRFTTLSRASTSTALPGVVSAQDLVDIKNAIFDELIANSEDFRTAVQNILGRLALDKSNPLTTNDDNSIQFGSVTISAVNGATDTVQTRDDP